MGPVPSGQAVLPSTLSPAAAADVLTLLVGQALDDIDVGRLGVASALRMVAEIAWKHGHDQVVFSPR